ncbi:unannotated protein [freshwater metagenome]|uniref:Unannotated protein n=1 Tax=freshwater metagenome TaxID=449393 RepID=A0A6J6YLN7_9ZZZZ
MDLNIYLIIGGIIGFVLAFVLATKQRNDKKAKNEQQSDKA